jgi:DNA-binding MarR family transcriptional regulator
METRKTSDRYKRRSGKVTRATEMLENNRRIVRLHDGLLKDICSENELTMLEGTILRFLTNNPGIDTAAEIAELRQLSKGNVSTAVEKLIRKGLLERRQDPHDRRVMHLTVTAAAEPVVRAIRASEEVFRSELFDGFTDREIEVFQQLNDRIFENTRKALGKREAS